MKPRIGGLELDPHADLALPLLLNLGVSLTVWLLAWAVVHWVGVQLVPGISAVAFLLACESYLFTTLFAVREVDVPDALRWVEMVLLLVLAKVIAAWPVATGLVDAVTGAWTSWSMWLGFGLLGYAWFQGGQAARQLQYLHPGLQAEAGAQDRLARDDHGRAFTALQGQVFGQVAAVAVLLGIGAWTRGDVRLWGWSWLGFGLLALTVLAAGATLVAAQLKARITWAQERLEAHPAVFARWAPIGLSLMLAPMLAALLLPAGPRLPAEYLVNLLNSSGTRLQVEPPQFPQSPSQGPAIPPELLEGQKPWVTWTWQIPTWFWYALGAVTALWVLRLAAKQLAERVGGQELKGLLAVLALLAAWYLALWKALGETLGGVLRQAVATPAEALGALFSEAGAVGRFLPVTRRAPGDPRAALRFYFARLQTEAGRKGLGRSAGTTAAEFSRRLAEAAPERAGEIAELTAAYQEARYSDLPVPAERASFARRAWVSIARALVRRRRPTGGER
ncbi:MAG TPA: DUF4129 domain-containing protein [Symbiobacteriaceae bacterium]|nr:DUF4129 domain-containing protein [Symbiobacteriaceae bacterium]